jgi:hypothetical protein
LTFIYRDNMGSHRAFLALGFALLFWSASAAQPMVGGGDSLQKYFLTLPAASDSELDSLEFTDARTWSEFFGQIASELSRLAQDLELKEEQLRSGQRLLDEATRKQAEAERQARAVEQESASIETSLTRALEAARAGLVTSAELRTVEEAAARQRAARDQARRNVDAAEADTRASREKVEQLSQAREGASHALETVRGRPGPLQIGALLNRELKIGGTTIQVRAARSANDAIGLADCSNGQPVITLALNPGRAVLPAAVVFVREHELAHHALGHMDCSSGQRRRGGGPQQELDADCWAARSLSQLPDGNRAVDIAAGNIARWNYGATATHPAASVRADALINGCQSPIFYGPRE